MSVFVYRADVHAVSAVTIGYGMPPRLADVTLLWPSIGLVTAFIGRNAVTVSRGLTHAELIADNQMPRSSCLLTEYKHACFTRYRSIPNPALLLQLINGFISARLHHFQCLCRQLLRAPVTDPVGLMHDADGWVCAYSVLLFPRLETIEAYKCTVAKVTYGSMCGGVWGRARIK